MDQSSETIVQPATESDAPLQEFNKRIYAQKLEAWVLANYPELAHNDQLTQMVRVFHKVYEQPIRFTPQHFTNEELELRDRLITEEYQEFKEGFYMYKHRDKVAGFKMMMDALGDLAYVIEGTFITAGVDSSDIKKEIQLSNMSKLGPDGKVLKRADGKVIKGPNYFPPDFTRFLHNIKPAEIKI